MTYHLCPNLKNIYLILTRVQYVFLQFGLGWWSYVTVMTDGNEIPDVVVDKYDMLLLEYFCLEKCTQWLVQLLENEVVILEKTVDGFQNFCFYSYWSDNSKNAWISCWYSHNSIFYNSVRLNCRRSVLLVGQDESKFCQHTF